VESARLGRDVTSQGNLAGSTIVLCGGPLNQANVPIGKGGSNAMVPINGRPVIGWVFDDLVLKRVDSAIVVLRRENERVLNFLHCAFGDRIKVVPAFLDEDRTILDSLAAGLRLATRPGPVRLVLGDTLIRDSFESDEDFIYAGEVEDSRRWCVVVPNESGHAVEYFDKQELSGQSHLAVAGYYHLLDRACLEASVSSALAAGERELSAALARYGSTRPVSVRRPDVWYDFGHVDNYATAKRELLQSRFFNSLKIDAFLNTITKISTDNEKLED
jgi:NDP-sugar pyrophosphorylase family protein